MHEHAIPVISVGVASRSLTMIEMARVPLETGVRFSISVSRGEKNTSASFSDGDFGFSIIPRFRVYPSDQNPAG
jgi:hypothetical protein